MHGLHSFRGSNAGPDVLKRYILSVSSNPATVPIRPLVCEDCSAKKAVKSRFQRLPARITELVRHSILGKQEGDQHEPQSVTRSVPKSAALAVLAVLAGEEVVVAVVSNSHRRSSSRRFLRSNRSSSSSSSSSNSSSKNTRRRSIAPRRWLGGAGTATMVSGATVDTRNPA